MKSDSYAAFRAAAELPDRDDTEELPPSPVCEACNLELSSAPAGVYVDCDECGACYLSRWQEPEPEWTSAEYHAMRIASDRSHLMVQIAEYVTTGDVASLASLVRHYADKVFANEARDLAVEVELRAVEGPPCF